MPAPAYSLWLAGIVTPTLNQTLRQHWRQRGQKTRAMAWAIRAAVGRAGLPATPLMRARVEIERRSAGPGADTDGLVGGCKGLIDCLLPMVEKRRPYGLGFVHDDSPKHMELVVRACRVPRADVGTLVIITPLDWPTS
ncbi:hypothetical protein EOD42_22300 [Rhodovarius crocodyli]|uniref:Uncharacterized protein n=1 Tax=Rhodovarius crocodyli TaxID=1979269 RepID=A0A437M0Z5_9PROT|nr:hypothetical protein [Rhodovarius crocodyli]RVT91389.1 hypothetical protein EOD42_22300 [Rhodovarius crocodyli]